MSEFERRVSRNLQCPVCFELLSDPKQLSCTHTFCKKCLNDILKCSSTNSLTCPICRSETFVKDGNVLNLNTNVPLKSLIDDVRNSQQVCETCDSNSRAVHFCCECGKKMCNTCLENHKKWPLNDKHRVVRVEDVREGRVVIEKEVYCQEHKADKQKHLCTDVCITCKKFICLRCRLLSHENKGHIVQNTEEYNASTETHIVSLQAQGKTKATTIKDHMTCIKAQKKRVTDHIAAKKAEIDKSYQESLKKLEERKAALIKMKAALDKQIDAQEVKLCKRLDVMKDVDERLVTSIESASVLAGNCMKAPLEGDIIVIRDTLSGELKNVLDRDDPEKKLATDVADRAKQLIFTPNNQYQCDQLNIGEVRFVKCELECDVELSKKDCMNGMAATPDGRMAVGYSNGGIDIFSPEGQLQKTVLKDVGISRVGYLSDGRCVILNDIDRLTLYTQEYEKLDVTFDTLSKDEGGSVSLTVDSNDLIYVGYWKATKIQVFSPAGGKAIREIPCDGYEPRQITSYNDVLIIKYGNTVRIIEKEGNVKHKAEESNVYSYAGVTQNNSILVAWVKYADGLVSIDEYTSELKHVQTLISDHKIEKPKKRNWYYIHEFRSGEIAFCTPDRLYIFN
ncbi:uncharacterized protein LOC105446250 [Strongylocentrotus purpuratus]|uniref:Uncharacterized protein n=1 Tax=Strongylocentrotus purpuratus TaxID=7668 RepID=A0A7M7HQ10_STRPU|nr:uncharacterized protein LOC105446250 [Strongylocentrotus purpuratus]